MKTNHLAAVLAHARQSGTLTSKPVNNAIRVWVMRKDTRHARTSMIALRRMVAKAEQDREAGDGS